MIVNYKIQLKIVKKHNFLIILATTNNLKVIKIEQIPSVWRLDLGALSKPPLINLLKVPPCIGDVLDSFSATFLEFSSSKCPHH